MCLIRKYPALTKAALEVAYDNGMVHRDCTEGQFLERQDSVLSSVDASDLSRLEHWLSGLSEEDMSVLCTGDQDDAEIVMQSCPTGGPDNQQLCRLLDDIFEN